MDRVSSFLTTVLNRRGLTAHAEGALAKIRAENWLSEHLPEIRPFTHIRGSKDGQLVISCENAIAMQECQSIADSLLLELKRDSACGSIRSIRVERA
jgi:hypothetical protein